MNARKDEQDYIDELMRGFATESTYKRCYQCDRAVPYLFDDGRCEQCTRLTPEEVTGGN